MNTDKKRKQRLENSLIWYDGIKSGMYTIQELVELKNHKFTYDYIRQNLIKMGVQKIVPEYRFKNKKYWKWLGDEYYLNEYLKKKRS